MMNAIFSYPAKLLWPRSTPSSSPSTTTESRSTVEISFSPTPTATPKPGLKRKHDLPLAPPRPSTTPWKRPRPKSPKASPPTSSPLVRRIPSLLRDDEEFVPEPERASRESTPRSKRLRRSSQFFEPHPMTVVTNAAPSSEAEAEAEDEESLIREADEEQQMTELQAEGFTAQEAQLFLRIQNRGREPLLPKHWMVDFSTMPDNLFFSEKGNQVGHIDSVSLDGSFQATNALQALVVLGASVRGRIEGKKDPEDRVMAALKKYIQWSVEDVKTSNYKQYSEINPRIVLVRSNGRGAVYTEEKVQKKLTELAAEVREEDAKLAAAGVPRDEETASSTLYGIAVSGAVVALLTLDARKTDEDAVRTMIILDFSDITLDFWNAIAVALLVMSAREDELARHEFYRSNDLKMALPTANTKRRGWESKARLSAAFDAEEEDHDR